MDKALEYATKIICSAVEKSLDFWHRGEASLRKY